MVSRFDLSSIHAKLYIGNKVHDVTDISYENHSNGEFVSKILVVTSLYFSIASTDSSVTTDESTGARIIKGTIIRVTTDIGLDDGHLPLSKFTVFDIRPTLEKREAETYGALADRYLNQD